VAVCNHCAYRQITRYPARYHTLTLTYHIVASIHVSCDYCAALFSYKINLSRHIKPCSRVVYNCFYHERAVSHVDPIGREVLSRERQAWDDVFRESWDEFTASHSAVTVAVTAEFANLR